MKNIFDRPFLTDFYQIVGYDTMKFLDKKGFIDTSNINWGPDREVDLSMNDTSVKSQWDGTCTSFAVTAAIENLLKKQYELSERSLWDFYGVYSTVDAIKSASTYFILEEVYWPQHQIRFDRRFRNKGRFRLANFVFHDDNYLEVLRAIDKGNPCVVALQTPEDLYNFKPQVERNSRILKGGHAICVSGYKVENGRAYFKVKNSWGTKCGLNGYQYVDFAVFDNKGYASFWEFTEVFDRGDQQMEFIDDDATLTSYADE